MAGVPNEKTSSSARISEAVRPVVLDFFLGGLRGFLTTRRFKDDAWLGGGGEGVGDDGIGATEARHGGVPSGPDADKRLFRVVLPRTPNAGGPGMVFITEPPGAGVRPFEGGGCKTTQGF